MEMEKQVQSLLFRLKCDETRGYLWWKEGEKNPDDSFCWFMQRELLPWCLPAIGNILVMHDIKIFWMENPAILQL